ncbi:hypothetical protein WG908_09970 [Sphingobium sp. AN641]|uniref:hypothetical protein n=1 Tax=Sphingobium sp. AN641 TaxID=3133443 RepID=UPI0030BBAF87
MLGAIRRSEHARGLLTALALLVFAIQLIAPSGFMPIRTDRGVVVTLCTGQGAVNVIVHRDSLAGDDAPATDDRATTKPCIFAGAAAHASLPSLALAEETLPAWTLAFGTIAFALKTGWIARLAAPPPPALGPPMLF